MPFLPQAICTLSLKEVNLHIFCRTCEIKRFFSYVIKQYNIKGIFYENWKYFRYIFHNPYTSYLYLSKL
jgi:hypothetical protein